MIKKVWWKALFVIVIVINSQIHFTQNSIVLPLFRNFDFYPIQNSAEEDYLIIRIIDAEFPPEMNVIKKKSFTYFSFNIDYQIENPTQSNFTIFHKCSILPFPHLEDNLKDKSLKVERLIGYHCHIYTEVMYPGIKNLSCKVEFIVTPYTKENLPKGEYEIWLDYVNSSTPVQVIKEKLIINVSSTKITYLFEYNSEIREVESLRKKYYSVFILFIPILLLVIIFRMKKKYKINRRKRIKKL